MSNLFDYLYWRGDLTLRHAPFNVIDSLILTRLSYLPFDGIINNGSIAIQDAARRFLSSENAAKYAVKQADIDLLKTLATSKRFKRMKLQHYTSLLDVKKQLQFSAILIQLNRRTSFIAFRGTDKNLVAWKEDLNMSFMKQVAAQSEALRYLNQVYPDIKDCLILGGHSKGGHLAVYAGAFTDVSIQEKIIDIYNFDGPGFNELLCDNPKLQTITNRIHAYTPETSLVGSLMYSPVNPTIIQSNGTGFSQHDLYTWAVDLNRLRTVEHVTPTSRQITDTTVALLGSMSFEERQLLIDTFYNILIETGVTKVTDINRDTIQKLMAVDDHFPTLSPKTRTLIMQLFGQLFRLYTPKRG